MKPAIPRPRETDQARAALIYAQLGRSPGGAWKEARQALKDFPKSWQLRFVAGLVLIALDRKTEARRHFAEAIRLGTPEPDAYLNLALLSVETGHRAAALDTLDRAERRFGADLRVLTARVNVLRAAADPEAALAAAGAALGAHPDAADLRVLHALLLAETGQLLAAIAALDSLLETRPDHVIARINLGRFLAFANQPRRALAVTERAHALAPALPAVLENLAIRRREAGDFAGAAALFGDLLAQAPAQAPEALRQLADLVPAAQIDTLAAEIDRQAGLSRGGEARARLGFARATLAKRQGDDAGFARALKAANRAMAALRPHDARADRALHEGVRAQFDAEAPTPLADPAPLPAIPVFVMGLPRSGTTLLERMLSMAPEAAGLGEVALVNRHFAGRLARGQALAGAIGDLRRDYAAFQSLAGAARWSIDKMPVNYVHMGWIAHAFPEARLVLLRRDPRDLALSIFEACFDDPGQNFSFDEAGIAQRLALFEETVAAWRARGVSFCDLSYEDLVSAPEASLRRVTAHCGMPFDPAMLQPERNADSIRTASALQARRAINRDSVARWQRYPDLLPRIFAG